MCLIKVDLEASMWLFRCSTSPGRDISLFDSLHLLTVTIASPSTFRWLTTKQSVCLCACVRRILTTAVVLTCPRPELGRGDEAAVAQHPHSGGGHQPAGEPPTHPGHGQSPDPEERRLHLPQHEISAGRHSCTTSHAFTPAVGTVG